MPETDTHREDIFLRKLMNKANIGWWEADVKTECYKCSGFIAQLLGLDEEGIISFNDFNKRILREDQDIWHSRNTRRTTYGVRLPGIAEQ